MISIPKVDFSQFTPVEHEGEYQIVALMEHVASGAKSVWNVYDDSGSFGQFDSYDAANAIFDTLPPERHPALCLYTRVGTAVVFRYRGAK